MDRIRQEYIIAQQSLSRNRTILIPIMEQQNILTRMLTRMPTGMFITGMYTPKRKCVL